MFLFVFYVVMEVQWTLRHRNIYDYTFVTIIFGTSLKAETYNTHKCFC